MTLPQVIKLHARKGPSGSPRWTICHASFGREKAANRARESNDAADSGTVDHDLGEGGLRHGDHYITDRKGCKATVTSDGTTLYGPPGSALYAASKHLVDDERIEAVMRYVDYVRQLAMGAELMIEQRLSIEHITDEEGAKGTSDTVLLFPDEICIIDLKGGFRRVMASYPLEGDYWKYSPHASANWTGRLNDPRKRFPNTQLVMYADGARFKFDPEWQRFKRVRIIIAQPRLNHIDEYVMERKEFETWVAWIREQALACDAPNPRVVPGEKQCEYCDVYPCAEAQQFTLEQAFGDFERLEDLQEPPKPELKRLGQLKRIAPMLRKFAEWVDNEVATRLRNGEKIEGFKLVRGDEGDRYFDNPTMVQLELRAMGLDPALYHNEPTFKGPAAVERMVKGPRSADRPLTKDQWEVIKPYIKRDPGGPKVVPDTDPRAALVEDHSDAFTYEDQSNDPFA